MAQLPTKVVTGKVRLSYAHLFEPYAQDETQTAKYSTMILVPKTDKKTIKAIEEAQQNALQNGKATKFNGSIPKSWKNTFRDADEEYETEDKDAADYRPEMKGMMFMTVSSNTRPGIVDRAVQPILDATEVYSGCYARLSLNAAAFNTQGNKGVTFFVNHVQKLADGEALGGRSRAEDEFDALDDEDDLI